MIKTKLVSSLLGLLAVAAACSGPTHMAGRSGSPNKDSKTGNTTGAATPPKASNVAPPAAAETSQDANKGETTAAEMIAKTNPAAATTPAPLPQGTPAPANSAELWGKCNAKNAQFPAFNPDADATIPMAECLSGVAQSVTICESEPGCGVFTQRFGSVISGLPSSFQPRSWGGVAGLACGQLSPSSTDRGYLAWVCIPKDPNISSPFGIPITNFSYP